MKTFTWSAGLAALLVMGMPVAAQQQEFALPQGDSVEASGFVQHLRLPHHVTFEADLLLLRQLREDAAARAAAVADADRPEGPAA